MSSRGSKNLQRVDATVTLAPIGAKGDPRAIGDVLSSQNLLFFVVAQSILSIKIIMVVVVVVCVIVVTMNPVDGTRCDVTRQG